MHSTRKVGRVLDHDSMGRSGSKVLIVNNRSGDDKSGRSEADAHRTIRDLIAFCRGRDVSNVEQRIPDLADSNDPFVACNPPVVGPYGDIFDEHALRAVGREKNEARAPGPHNWPGLRAYAMQMVPQVLRKRQVLPC